MGLFIKKEKLTNIHTEILTEQLSRKWSDIRNKISSAIDVYDAILDESYCAEQIIVLKHKRELLLNLKRELNLIKFSGHMYFNEMPKHFLNPYADREEINIWFSKIDCNLTVIEKRVNKIIGNS